MIHMGLLNFIRRMHLRQMLSIREIARLTGVSRYTVTKHLAANTIEPKFATPDHPSKLAPFSEKLAGWLKTEAEKSRKQQRTFLLRTTVRDAALDDSGPRTRNRLTDVA